MSPALTSLPCSKVRAVTIPATLARNSAIRVGAMRPGNSRICGRGDCSTVTIPTSGGAASAEVARAGVPSEQPASGTVESAANRTAKILPRYGSDGLAVSIIGPLF